jgi:hypothetical protein
MTRRLPITIDPAAGESWDSYLTRTAAANQSTVVDLADRIGLRPDRHWPAFHGVIIGPARGAAAATALDIDEQTIDRMQLAAFDQVAIDLRDLAAIWTLTAARSASRRAWVRYTGSRYCPDCLAADGTWKLTWRLPWTTCCPTHRIVLAYRCPACGQPARSGRSIATTRPVRGHGPPDGKLCTQSLPNTYGHSCQADLTATITRSATRVELKRAATVRRLLDRERGQVFGQRWSALDCFGVWQRAACYALALRQVTIERNRWETAHPWISPPRDPEVILDLLDSASDLVDAPSIAAGAEVLGRWCEQAELTPTPSTFRDAAPRSPAMQPAIDLLLTRVGRSHSVLLRSIEQLDGQHRLALTGWDISDVPQLVWSCALPAALRSRTSPGQAMLRAVMALTLARIAGARTWAQAGAALGWNESQGTRWSSYVFGRADLRQQIIAAALETAGTLGHQPRQHAWALRPQLAGRTLDQLAAGQSGQCVRDDSASGWCPCHDRSRLAGVTSHVAGSSGLRRRHLALPARRERAAPSRSQTSTSPAVAECWPS